MTTAAQHEPGLDRVEDREVELRRERLDAARAGASRSRRSRRASCAARAARAAGSVSRSSSASSSAAKGTASGSSARSRAVGGAEEPVAAVQHRRGRGQPGLRGRRRTSRRRGGTRTSSPRRGGGAHARRPQAEVDLLAVALAERLLVEPAAAARRRLARISMQNPTPVITSGRRPSELGARRSSAQRRSAGRSPSRSNASMIVRGSVQMEPKFVSGVTVATSGRPAGLDQPVEPAGGHQRVGVEDHHVAAVAARPRFTVRTKPRFSGLRSTRTGTPWSPSRRRSRYSDDGRARATRRR